MAERLDALLGGLATLLCVAETGSATRAARTLGATPATVLRRLSALEATLGVALFDRTPTGLKPTAALELVLPWAEQASAAATGLEREVAGIERAPVGVVRLAALPGLASAVLAPALPALRARHPDLTLELVPSSATVALARREADLAVRTVRPTSGDLVVHRLRTFRLAVMGAPRWLAAGRGARRASGAAALRALPWLAFTDELAHAPELAWLRGHVPEPRFALRSPDLATLLAAAAAGAGALLVADSLGHVAGLVEVVRPPALPTGELWLVAHRAVRPVPRVAAVWEWLRATLDEARPAARGR